MTQCGSCDGLPNLECSTSIEGATVPEKVGSWSIFTNSVDSSERDRHRSDAPRTLRWHTNTALGIEARTENEFSSKPSPPKDPTHGGLRARQSNFHSVLVRGLNSRVSNWGDQYLPEFRPSAALAFASPCVSVRWSGVGPPCVFLR